MKPNQHNSRKFFAPVILIVSIVVLIAIARQTSFLKCAQIPDSNCLRWAKIYLASFDLGAPDSKTSTKSERSPVDGMMLIYIPAGEFPMGTTDKGFPSSGPEHTVYLDAFWMDQTEVSNAMYLRCVAAGKCIVPTSSEINPFLRDPFYGNYPVVYMGWENASDYCSWAGRRLPTEAEWEKAARGTSGQDYPWGNQEPNIRLANYGNYLGGPVPVDRYKAGASPYGVLNMAGNVREWVNDWYSPVYYGHSPLNNPRGPDRARRRSLRGGSFLDDERQLRTYNRFEHSPSSAGIDRGFRCAMSAN